MTMVSESPTVGNEIIDTNRALLRDSIDLLERLPADVYSTPHLEGASSIGAHIRHVLEHYDCFLVGLQRGAIDYTARARAPEIEASTAAAVRRAESVISGLDALDAVDRPVRVPVLGHGEGTVDSTAFRELQFLASHTIHHHAMVGLLCRIARHPVPEDFGLAPSTLRQRRAGG